ncbi:MAG TPA: adenylate/guanylate cyclase domain-containing protein [Candidatus Wallbacteria bacterium]|nr:adenylate/guanylate cyclase domain-containing protein [Candidatus Wallbacteria bacterium]
MNLKFLGKKYILLIILTLSAFACYELANSSIGKIFDRKWRDMLFAMRGPEPPDDRIVICALEEDSFEELEQELPFTPQTYIKFFENLHKLGVRVVGLDFILYEFYKSEPDANDTLLKKAFQKLNSVVFASKIESYFRKQKIGTSEISLISTKHKTSNRFFAETGKVGLINSALDFDGVKRSSALVINQNDSTYETFIFKLYESFLEHSPSDIVNTLPTTAELALKRKNFIINYAGGPRHFIEVPFYAIVEMPEKSIPLLRKKYENKIFIVGPTYYESHDFFDTPFSNSQYVQGYKMMSGVETIANSLHTLLNNKFINVLNKSDYNRLFFFISLLSVLSFGFIRNFWLSSFFAALYSSTVFYASYDCFIRGSVFLDVFNLILVIFSLYFISNLIKITIVESEKHFMRSTLNRYMSANVVEKILRDGELVSLSGETAEVAVMFADVRNFTTISEKLTAKETVKLLNIFFKKMVDIVFQNEGTLDKFIGDCIMVVFGAPRGIKSPASRALKCAIEMQRSIIKFKREKDPVEYNFDFSIGIGVSFGKCVVGNIGSEKRMEYTAIGDVVNVSSRIQSLAGAEEINFTSETYDAIKNGDPDFYESIKNRVEIMDEVRLKGREKTVLLYRLRVEQDQ